MSTHKKKKHAGAIRKSNMELEAMSARRSNQMLIIGCLWQACRLQVIRIHVYAEDENELYSFCRAKQSNKFLIQNTYNFVITKALSDGSRKRMCHRGTASYNIQPIRMIFMLCCFSVCKEFHQILWMKYPQSEGKGKNLMSVWWVFEECKKHKYRSSFSISPHRYMPFYYILPDAWIAAIKLRSIRSVRLSVVFQSNNRVMKKKKTSRFSRTCIMFGIILLHELWTFELIANYDSI